MKKICGKYIYEISDKMQKNMEIHEMVSSAHQMVSVVHEMKFGRFFFDAVALEKLL